MGKRHACRCDAIVAGRLVAKDAAFLRELVISFWNQLGGR